MNFVTSFNMFGTDAMQIPCIAGSGTPTTSTAGAVGMLYMDTSSSDGELWKCTGVNGAQYIWTKLIPDYKVIRDVVELPTENIDESAFYRLLTGTFYWNGGAFSAFSCNMVETLPDVGEPATNIDMSHVCTYYDLNNKTLSGYVNNDLATFLGVPVGWYPAEQLFSVAGYNYSGIVSSPENASDIDTFYLVLEGTLYQYQDTWKELNQVGWRGQGGSAEIFNSLHNIANGNYSHAEGFMTRANNDSSHAEGRESQAEGSYSHAEGNASNAKGDSSHAEGEYSIAEGNVSHAEGYGSHAIGNVSHAEGYESHAQGNRAHAEGFASHAKGDNSHAEGYRSHAEGDTSHAEGLESHAKGDNSHAEGSYSHAEGTASHAEGSYSHAEGSNSHAEGEHSDAGGTNSHAEGNYSHAEGEVSHAEGSNSHAEGYYSHAEGYYSHAEGNNSHAEGTFSNAAGLHSHAEGNMSHAGGNNSHAEGRGYVLSRRITGMANSTTYTIDSTDDLTVGLVVRYNKSTVFMPPSFNSAKIIAIDTANSKITINTTLSKDLNIDNGEVTIYAAGLALGDSSHVEGTENIAAGRAQHVQGEYNIIDPEYDVNDTDKRGKYAHIVGNGTSSTNRSNMHTLDWEGNAWYSGDIYVGSTNNTNRDDGSKKVATEEYVNNAISSIPAPDVSSAINDALYTEQKLTEDQKAQARTNIGLSDTDIQNKVQAYVNETILGGAW